MVQAPSSSVVIIMIIFELGVCIGQLGVLVYLTDA